MESVRLGLDRLGLVCCVLVRIGWLGKVWLGKVRLGWVELETVRLCFSLVLHELVLFG